jgi:hypothetical protein
MLLIGFAGIGFASYRKTRSSIRNCTRSKRRAGYYSSTTADRY